MQVRAAGGPVSLPGAAERALLALLLLSPNRTVAATTLVDRLWVDERLPADPLNALQLRVSKLRRHLANAGIDIVSRDGPGYRADVEADTIDVHVFAERIRIARGSVADAERAESARDAAEALSAYDEALSLWRGEPLADFVTQPWATVEAARLTQLRLAALTERSQLALSVGRHAEVVADLGPVVGQDPTHETLAGLLMTALFGGGRQAEALEIYARTRAVLDEELGLEPSAALRALHQRVLQQDATLIAAQPRSVPARPAVVEPLPGPATNVPSPVGQLIARDSEIASIRRLVGDGRLVSLVGPGGAGKTALSLAVAHDVSAEFPDGVWVARLASVTDPADVPMAVADALGVPLDGAAPGQARDRIINYLARRRTLLVLDNCEHVVDAAARLAEEILAAASEARILTTSREALAVSGEVQFAVAPLDVPPEGTRPDEILRYGAARLFLERAVAVRPQLDADDSELDAVGRIARQLDGMPLALELAAARASSLSFTELADRLTDRFALLTGGARTAEARQRTLRATVDWSHALLDSREQTVFRRLAVFHGGWTLDSAEAVVSAMGVSASSVLDLLSRLVDRSLVIADPGRPTRYRMLETLRQYAAERLDASGERDAVADRHAAHFVQLAEAAEYRLRGQSQRETLRRLRDEQPNLRAALNWLEADPARHDDALRLAAALGWFWTLGRHLEGREVLRRLITKPARSPQVRARALQAVSLVERPRACLVHPSPRCAETAEESLKLFEELGDFRRAALSRVLLAVEGVRGAMADETQQLLAEAEAQFTADDDPWGHAVIAFVRMETFLKTGDEARAVPTGRAAAAAFRALDDPWGLSAVLYHLGWGLRQFGRYAEAVPVLEEAIDVATSAGLYNTVQWALADLGIALLHLGDVDGARERFERAGAASEEIGDRAGEVLATYGEGVLARVARDAIRARDLFAAAAAGFEALGTPAARGLAVTGLAWCHEQQGEADEATARYSEVLAVGESVGEPGLVASALEGLARVAAMRGDRKQARSMLDRAGEVRSLAARPAPPHERQEIEPVVAT
jgi:predicted ATPase/DNA-binding SARP family transcriptional activator